MADLTCSLPPATERLVCEVEDAASAATPPLCSVEPPAEELPAPAPPGAAPRASPADSAEAPDRSRAAAPPLVPSMLRAAASCSGHLHSVALTLLQAQASPLSAIVSGIKAGYELGRCVANERDAELQLQAELHAVEECKARGGTPDELSQTKLTCVMPTSTRSRA